MKLVKARLKQDFQNVLQAQCCPEYLQHIKDDPNIQGILTFDLDDSATDPICCAYCNAEFGLVHGVTNIADGLLYPLDLFDLDEGGYGPN